MSLESGDNSEFDGAFRRKEHNAVAGRRRRQTEDGDESKPPPSAAEVKKSGWGDGASSSSSHAPEAPRIPEPRDDDVMPVIPDLEEAHEEEVAAAIAEPAQFKANRVQPLKELDRDIRGGLPSAMESEGINLSILTSVLMPQALLVRSPDSILIPLFCTSRM
eukprot:TRINITY_DN1660_c0_g1_i2.p1 TRINITY_DN1660_c0_g1~~TRINITY_DN1660_c0_g1_i2.p1  ORF type:complete len:162 (-),score=36.71 TRINITY_DN1660_c0_g1_i2:558-1043(-)